MTHKNIKSSLRTFSFLEPLKSSYFFGQFKPWRSYKGCSYKKQKQKKSVTPNKNFKSKNLINLNLWNNLYIYIYLIPTWFYQALIFSQNSFHYSISWTISKTLGEIKLCNRQLVILFLDCLNCILLANYNWPTIDLIS